TTCRGRREIDVKSGVLFLRQAREEPAKEGGRVQIAQDFRDGVLSRYRANGSRRPRPEAGVDAGT
ncbi:MAG: hypothetical protein WCE51_02365, partial [Chthoniobacterales bacterium]